MRESDAEPPADQEGLRALLDVPLSGGLLELALTHRSYAYENGGLPTNERLEFLGDSVLGVVITDEIYCRHPELAEGQLAKMRASVVNMRALAGVARTLELGRYLRLGRGEETTGGRDKASILADTVEALIGATWLTGGLALAAPLVHRLFDPLLEVAADLGAALDWKTSVQELSSTLGLGPPDYVVGESGPDHAKVFHASVRLDGDVYGTGSGPSKKEAEQRAADQAWHRLTDLRPTGAGPAGADSPDSNDGTDAPDSTDTDAG